MILSKYIGDKKFYKKVLAVLLPIFGQSLVTNLVNLLDNIMVGAVGTEQMSGVSIVNELMFVFNLCIFGAISGAGIFTAQYFGKSDNDGVRNTFRIKLIIVGIIAAVSLSLFTLLGTPLISLFLHEGSAELDLEATLGYGKSYLAVIIFQVIPFALTQAYSDTLKETGETVVPMCASISAVAVNTALNYILIFGKFGAPRLGVVGAALATVIARITEMLIVLIWTHTHKEKAQFIVGAYRSFRIPKKLISDVVVKGTPIMLNEALWSAGMAVLSQRYSTRGLDAVSAINICTTATNLFSCGFFSAGTAVGIIIGQLLGAGETERAKDEDRKLIANSVFFTVFIAVIMASVSGLIPEIYNTTDTVKGLATDFLLISACLMPIQCLTHCSYFTIRSGGNTIVTFLFDCVFTWIFSVLTAFILTEYTAMTIVPIYAIVQSLELIKAVIGVILVKRGVWVNNIVDEIS